MTDELDAKVEILTALFNSGDADAGGQFYALVKTWERRDVEIAFCRVVRILATTARTPAAAAAADAAKPPTANSTLEAMGEIMHALTHGRITAADAKARLYAHQIALSALRTIDNAKAARQKEERLRKSQTNTIRRASATAPTASPRRRRTTKKNARRRNPHSAKTKTTTKPIARDRK
jgi:hypothetical protein